MTGTAARVIVTLALGGPMHGCGVSAAMLSPAGPQAAHVAWLWWFFVAICAVVYGLVLATLAVALWRRRADAAIDGGLVPRSRRTERRLRLAVGGGTALTVLTLFGLMATSFGTGRALSSLSQEGALNIRVTGHQWWWELEYEGEPPSNTVITANEMHIPVGRPIALYLTSADVIHTFWAPALSPKRDLIPGRITTLAFRADREGVFRAPCAEFCGVQHALMTMLVVAEPAERFEQWLAAQRQSATAPAGVMQQRGQQVFLAGQCPMCHRVAGTSAGGSVGPDLTHVASRTTIAAGTLPNQREHLAAWLTDPQAIKPGTKMPLPTVAGADLPPLLDYLESLR